MQKVSTLRVGEFKKQEILCKRCVCVRANERGRERESLHCMYFYLKPLGYNQHSPGDRILVG